MRMSGQNEFCCKMNKKAALQKAERGREIVKKIAPAFSHFILDWYYEKYLLIGGYGSGKSYHTALKIILKCLEEKRKVLVVREVFETIKESCFELIAEILEDMQLLYNGEPALSRLQVQKLVSPLEFRFPNGSRIIFRGMDNQSKIKSIQGVSIIWIEECTELKFSSFEELLTRFRVNNFSMHILLTCNPVSKENWVYKTFFAAQNEKGEFTRILDEERLYASKEVIANGTFYLHTTIEDNEFLPAQYAKRLNELRRFDFALWRVARLGRFGAGGARVLPQIAIAENGEILRRYIDELGEANQYFGFDFGFEESYNAVVYCSVDIKNAVLIIWDEIYINKITDDKMAKLPKMQKLKEKLQNMQAAGYNKFLVADSEDPKAIAYYKQCGYNIRACKCKFVGSRLSNTRKIKRFSKILIAKNCKNAIAELHDLTYKKDRNGNLIYDEFNRDPHTFSALWYALDTVTVADYKDKEFYSRR